MMEATLQLMLEQCEELRKYKRAEVKTENSVIQDGIKINVNVVKNNIEDKIENSISAVSAGQEELKNYMQLVQQAFVGLPADFIQNEAAHAFVDGLRDREVKQHFLMGFQRLLNEALSRALILEATKVAAGPPVRLRQVTTAPAGTSLIPPERCRNGPPVCWRCGKASHF
jgi:hypothetical protein